MKKVIGIIAVIAIIGLAALWSSLVENVDADQICVIQDPIDGDLHVFTSPGLKFQGFGTVTKYQKSTQYWFTDIAEDGTKGYGDARTRFNDGAATDISGSVRWDFPLDEPNILELHTKYRSQNAVETALIKTVLDKSVYMSGPLMSSKESYSDKRNDLIFYILDQAKNGIYKTISKEEKEPDPITGVERTVRVVYIDKTESGIALRQEASPLLAYGIFLNNFSITKIEYSGVVEKQIEVLQVAAMSVQTAIAQAKEAEQRAIKAEKDGQAKATQAKWDQEVIKAKMVTEAEQKRDVSALAMEAAKYYKEEQILKGEGEAQRKKLVMLADGALDKKLKAYVEVNKNYATAISQYKGNWVPGIMMSSGKSGSASGGRGAQDMIDLLTIKTAKDLNLDMGIRSTPK